ncbi:phosphotransferase family protein [Mesoplasma corruscae]|uniref:Choline kinase n=1 Tax=Mesoplasma corruscae TaxID=216874 RepID=A0A2S5RG24_9MOLU|nr:phosphotransferase [Mesoplasma corruscae]PPE06284.1 choline kinase [Mesoplasma corruscae]
MNKNKILGLTNKINVKNNILYKESHIFCDDYLNRNNEIAIYDQLNKIKNKYVIIPFAYQKETLFTSQTHFFKNVKTLSQVNICTNKMLTIINIIKNIHNLKLENIAVFKPLDFLMFFKSNVQKEIQQLKVFDSRIIKILNNYWDDGSYPVFSHNDLVLNNFINFKKGWKVIDFEYASYNHYLFDYASFISESLPVKKHDKFIELLNLTEKEKKKLNDLILFQNYLWGYWALYMFEKTNNSIFVNIMNDKINALFRTRS